MLRWVMALALVCGVVRIWFPIDRGSYILRFIRVAYADLPRDLGLFVFGLLASQGRWLAKFPARSGRSWLLVGLAASLLWYAYVLFLRNALPLGEPAMGVAYVIWEELVCFGLCIGLVVFLRERLNISGRLSRALARSQYAAFVFHMPVVLALQAVALKTQLPPFAKFVLVTAVAIPATFAVSNWVRRPLHL